MSRDRHVPVHMKNNYKCVRWNFILTAYKLYVGNAHTQYTQTPHREHIAHRIYPCPQRALLNGKSARVMFRSCYSFYLLFLSLGRSVKAISGIVPLMLSGRGHCIACLLIIYFELRVRYWGFKRMRRFVSLFTFSW